jgi:hypothetical protein
MNVAVKIVEPMVSRAGAVDRVNALDWERVSHDLDAQGSAMMERLLSPDECQSIAGALVQTARLALR